MSSDSLSHRYCGRDFHAEEIDWIRHLISSNPRLNRMALAEKVCQHFHWYSPNGRLKEMSCRVAMLRMHRNGLITLPPPRTKNVNRSKRPKITSISDPQANIALPASELVPLRLHLVSSSSDSLLWNQLIERYHYLGYKPLSGAQLRYLVFSPSDKLLAAVGFGAAAWKVAPRDQFIGWSHDQRLKNLHLVVNNARFLILPWVSSKNLASKILALCSKRLPHDWIKRYNYSPFLLETFVEFYRFKGTCYRAANWIYLGKTKGRGKLDQFHTHSLPIKNIFVYPINYAFKKLLCS